MSDHRYTHNGEAFRVVIEHDVIALPRENWSDEGYGRHISEEWLLGSADLPGNKTRKRLLAYLIRRALADHYDYDPPTWPFKGEPPREGR